MLQHLSYDYERINQSNSTNALCLDQYCRGQLDLVGTALSGIMLVIFVIVIIFVCTVTFRTIKRGTIFRSELLFYCFILLYLLGRGIWFIIVTILRATNIINIPNGSLEGYSAVIAYHMG